ncbi:unnamed protein product [Peniophora sp. CBMAI 1063]|nr:unnamed protein product [Peniophora sp. CBMAI 1063]
MPVNLSRASTTQAIQATRPIYSYTDHSPSPTVHYIRTATELNGALTDFEGPYGFDCEYKALPVPGRTALVQLSNASRILLIQLSAFTVFPEKLKTILEDPSIKKIGHYTEADGAKLRDDYGILPKSLINLMPLARQIDPGFLALHPPRRNVTLAQIVLYYLDRTLPKGPVRVSNWELNPLTQAQREYAASDAYCAYEVYMRLMTLQEQNDPTLDPSKYTINIEPRAAPPPTIPPGKYYLERNNPRLSKFEFDAYMLWYHGYTAAEILKTFGTMFPMERMRGYFDGEGAIIAFIVAALRKDTSLPFDPIALRDMIDADEESRETHSAFLEHRCPAPADKSPDPPETPQAEVEPTAVTQQKRKREASASDKDLSRQPEEHSREATPTEDYADTTPTPADKPAENAAKPVKRSRTM